jgi:PadR family transcriptional regulator, regulatory protein PadR
MAGDSLVTQMRKGVLDYCVLALLHDRPRYGFEIVQTLGGIDGMLTSEGTIYPLLGRLRRDSLVQTEWKESSGGPPRRYYRATAEGRRALRAFREEWSTFRSGVDRILVSGGSL